jgi:hypothetical protein
MYQEAFFETRNYPFADIFDAGDAATTTAAEKTAVNASSELPKALRAATAQKCLKCGKPSAAMFCNATCRKTWMSSMSAFHNRLAKTNLVGSHESGLFESEQ